MSLNIGLLTKKLGMTHLFDFNSNHITVTILKAPYSIITNIIKSKIDLSCKLVVSSWQLNFSRLKKIKKARLSLFDKKKFPVFNFTKEYFNFLPLSINIGEVICLNVFKNEQTINASGKSIGKGFTGNIKRHGFSRGPMSHGSKHHRLQGSLGAGTTPGRVFPGKKMSGQSGNKNVTIKNLPILKLDLENNLIYLKGAVPGKKNNLVHIKNH